ncbi:MAG: chromosome segregation protein SMC [Candidatus Hatepunaea meridiana]|nr:chromosome segregation protein SMC [Candidatus Hatepunaea meridiana]
MFITKLEMIGFKSFASKTLLNFRSGVMSIVGPNGCGKTNIVDAFRWVLGEQRSGVLRAERMESVIFNGTPSRRPLGMSEVTLTIENDKGILPSPYTEIAITRRLFRSGESEYLINRSPVRLRDIKDLFVDTGLGNTAYSIIELSMVEGIITGPPDMRRLLFEEAAGVAKYKARRQAATRRLETTRDNLARIEDIYQEVEKTYRALKRQASRARRYQTLTKALQLRLIADLSNERLDLIVKRKPLEEQLSELQTEQLEAESESAQATSDLLSLEGQEIAVIDKYRRTQDSMKRFERREAELDRDYALIRQRQQFLEDETSKADQTQNQLEEKIKTTDTQTKSALSESKDIKNHYRQIQSELKRFRELVSKINTDLETTRRKLADHRRKEDEAGRKLSSYTEQLKHIENEKRRLIENLDKYRQQQDRLNETIENIKTDLTNTRKHQETARKNKETAIKRHSETITNLEKARQEHTAALSDKARCTAELEASRAALRAHRSRAGYSLTLPDKLRKIVADENLLSVADRIECRSEHLVAVTAVLKDVLEALDRPDLETVIDITREIEIDCEAILRFPIEPKCCQVPSPDSKKLPEEAKDCLQGPNLVQNEGEFGDFLRRRLADVLLAPDLDTLTRLIPFAIQQRLRLVTPMGELFESDGVIHAGGIDPEAMQVGWLAGLKDLETKVVNLETVSVKAKETVEATTQKLAAIESESAIARTSLREIEDDVIAKARRIDNLKADLERSQQRLNDVTDEIKQLQIESDQLSIQDTSDDQLIKLKSELDNASRLSRTANEESLIIERKRVELSDKLTATTAESARISERMAAMEKAILRFKNETQSAIDELAVFNSRLAERKVELNRVHQAADNIKAQIDLLNREKQGIADSLENITTQRSELKAKRDQITKLLNILQERENNALKQQNRLEVEVISLRERLRELDRRLEEDAGINPNSVTESSQLQAENELNELGMSELTTEKLKTRLQSIGPVNMLALDELPDVEERYRFLGDQKADLENGIEVIEDTIDHINHEARRVFRETFDRINRYFQDVFRTLFEGGEAQLVLSDGDPLEADVRIFATPSGKKLQTLSMLSGGEKALTAIALLFGIYKVRPSPFCIMDEVDAPLDDANIVRFNRLIRQYSVDTQFMIVTHNKRTMEAADYLFGVTLGEDGTSRMVSVKIEGKKEETTK